MENRLTLSLPFVIRWDLRALSLNMAMNPFRNSLMSLGFTKYAALLPISCKIGMSPAIIGTPEAFASITGIPKPSYDDGKLITSES